MLNIHNLSVSFGGSYLFEEVTFRLGAGDRVGLVGKNGAGKSTMLKILSKDIAPDSGTISQEKEIQIGFLRQDIDFKQGRTVLEEAYEAFTEIKIVEKKLEKSIVLEKPKDSSLGHFATPVALTIFPLIFTISTS